MKTVSRWPWLLFLPFVAVFTALSQDQPPPQKADEAAKPPTSGYLLPKKDPPLRRPGFIFLELETTQLADYVAFFHDVMEFEVTYRQGQFIQMETERAQLLLVHPQVIPEGHPFHGKITGKDQGVGVEIGLVVADLDKAYATSLRHKGFKISMGITRRPWGVRDFRVLSPDGYYLRFTEIE